MQFSEGSRGGGVSWVIGGPSMWGQAGPRQSGQWQMSRVAFEAGGPGATSVAPEAAARGRGAGLSRGLRETLRPPPVRPVLGAHPLSARGRICHSKAGVRGRLPSCPGKPKLSL